MELEVVDLSNDPNIPRTTSINANLSQPEKNQLVAILNEYADVFAWEYDEIPGLDPNLVAHALNVEPGVKPVIQPMQLSIQILKLKSSKKYKSSLQLVSLGPLSTQSGCQT